MTLGDGLAVLGFLAAGVALLLTGWSETGNVLLGGAGVVVVAGWFR